MVLHNYHLLKSRVGGHAGRSLSIFDRSIDAHLGGHLHDQRVLRRDLHLWPGVAREKIHTEEWYSRAAISIWWWTSFWFEGCHGEERPKIGSFEDREEAIKIKAVREKTQLADWWTILLGRRTAECKVAFLQLPVDDSEQLHPALPHKWWV